MPDPLSLTTSDPRFDPEAPVTVNGFLYVPAPRVAVRRRGSNTLVEVRRRRIVEPAHG